MTATVGSLGFCGTYGPRETSGVAKHLHYVYKLIDPRDGVPFYVGKGQGNRAWQHQREVELGQANCNARKIAKIREILLGGLQVEISIVAEYDNADDALNHEWELISSMPCLTNVGPGGEGRRLSALQIAKQQELRVARLAEQRRVARTQCIGRLQANRERMFTAIPGAERYRKEILNWLLGLHIDEASLVSRRRNRKGRNFSLGLTSSNTGLGLSKGATTAAKGSSVEFELVQLANRMSKRLKGPYPR